MTYDRRVRLSHPCIECCRHSADD